MKYILSKETEYIMRYQLIHTSPYLSGQVRWDIPLYYHYDPGTDDSSGHHMVDTPELYLSPLNDTLRFNEDDDRDILKYSHLENLKYMYDRLGKAFYSASGEWTGDYWLYNEGYKLDPYSHVFTMGARRTRFSRYKKQFTYLCPLWISEQTDPTKLRFEVSVRVINGRHDHIARMVFGLSEDICKYMSEFLNKSSRYVSPDPSIYTSPEDAPYMGVNDDLLSIKFDPDSAFITGVQVDAAKYSVRDISYMVPAILKREIPMMEFDNMLLSCFQNNAMVAQQLINLNFAFNLEDISFILKDTLLGKRITISMRVLYDGEYLDIKDLYTNYSNIPVYRTDLNRMDNTYNVLDYLGDHRIVDYMHANKFTQPIFHWSMVENPEYIYNFYDGFAPSFIGGEKEIHRISGRYYDQADISQDVHNVYNNAAHWCAMFDFTGMSNDYKNNTMTFNRNHYSDVYSLFRTTQESMIAYLRNNRYDLTKLNQDAVKNLWGKSIYMYSVIDPTYADPAVDYSVEEGGDVVILTFIHNNIKDATLRNIPKYLGNTPLDPDMWWLSDILTHLADAWIPPYQITFRNTTSVATVEPVGDKFPSEFHMYKQNDVHHQVLRYTGRLCPMFISPNDEYYKNILYGYHQWSSMYDDGVPEYNKMIKTGLTPDYPSIDYYTYTVTTDGTTMPLWYTDNWEGEIPWKNDGIIISMPERLTIITDPKPQVPYNEYFEEQAFWELLYNQISTMMSPTDTPIALSVWFKHWLKMIYDIHYNFEYAGESDVNNIIYTVTFELK